MQLKRLAAALEDRYRVERELGAGGMATVYLAEDLKHGRRVALKVLHPELAAVLGAERFLTEIKTTAHLQHPNILQLFDSGSADGLLYYVMPFVEGETLRGRLTREKQLPLNDAIAIARGAAAALDYAHRHGVIHRDIKPENILLQDGQPLVADFGIALAVKAAGGVRLTQTGLSLGTPQYMSPEQATAERELDARSDVYALGAVTYEMLAGEPPFTGNTTQAVIAKLMTEEPRVLSVLRRSVSPEVEAAVHRALEKLPADRFSSAAEFGAALGEGKASGYTGRTAGRAPPSLQPPRPAVGRVALVASVAVLLGGVLGWWVARRGNASPGPADISRLAILPPKSGGIVGTGIARVLDISRDGQVVVFSGFGPTSSYLAIRRLDGSAPLELPASDNALNVHISPDGRYLYSPRGTSHMQRVPLTGGTWTAVPGVEATPFLSWAADGTLWWSPDISRGLHRVPAGSTKDEIPFAPTLKGAATNHTIQQVLPGDRTALIIDNSPSNAGPVAIIDLESGKATTLLDFPVVEIRYTNGVLVYARPDNTLYGVSFDPAKSKVIGEPVQLADDVSLTGAGVAQFAVSANGTLVYLPTSGRELVLIERTGLTRPLDEAKLNYHSPRFSPDGRRVALDNIGPDSRDVWILDREQHQLIRATFDRDGHDPSWAPDGKSIFYSSAKSGTFGIYQIRPGVGGGTGDSIIADNSIAYTGTPLVDGKSLLTEAFDASGKSITDVVLIHPGQAKPIEPLFATPFNEGWAVPSPDNKWVAFTSDQTGRLEVFVHPLGTEGTLTQISQDGGSEPMWSPDEKELFYRRPNAGRVELVAAALRLDREVEVTKRTVLFDASDYEPAQPHANYDVSPDGKSFVMVKRSPSSHIVVIQNLLELMRRSRNQTAR